MIVKIELPKIFKRKKAEQESLKEKVEYWKVIIKFVLENWHYISGAIALFSGTLWHILHNILKKF